MKYFFGIGYILHGCRYGSEGLPKKEGHPIILPAKISDRPFRLTDETYNLGSSSE